LLIIIFILEYVGECAEVMTDMVLEHPDGKKTTIKRVYFVLFDEKSFFILDNYLYNKEEN
jgi:hypothetical protein